MAEGMRLGRMIRMTMVNTEHLLDTRHCTKISISVTLFKSYSNLVRDLSYQSYLWMRKLRLRRQNNVPKTKGRKLVEPGVQSSVVRHQGPMPKTTMQFNVKISLTVGKAFRNLKLRENYSPPKQKDLKLYGITNQKLYTIRFLPSWGRSSSDIFF